MDFTLANKFVACAISSYYRLCWEKGREKEEDILVEFTGHYMTNHLNNKAEIAPTTNTSSSNAWRANRIKRR